MPIVTGTFVKADGSPMSGELIFSPSVAVGSAEEIILPAPCRVKLKSGALSVDLVATDDVRYTPSGWVWSVKEQMPGGRPVWTFELTKDSDYWELLPIVPPEPIERFATLAGLNEHVAKTTDVHGIADTADLVVTSDLINYASSDHIHTAASVGAESAGTSLQKTSNLSDLANLNTAISNIRIGNLLSSNQATCGMDNNTVGFLPRADVSLTPYNTGNANGGIIMASSVANSSTPNNKHGFIIGSSATTSAVTSVPANGSIPVAGNVPVTLMLLIGRYTGLDSQLMTTTVHWFNASGGSAGSSIVINSVLIDSNLSTWMQATVLSPAPAVKAAIRVWFPTWNTATSIILYKAGLWFGPGGEWQPPGLAIPGLGYKIDYSESTYYIWGRSQWYAAGVF